MSKNNRNHDDNRDNHRRDRNNQEEDNDRDRSRSPSQPRSSRRPLPPTEGLSRSPSPDLKEALRKYLRDEKKSREKGSTPHGRGVDRRRERSRSNEREGSRRETPARRDFSSHGNQDNNSRRFPWGRPILVPTMVAQGVTVKIYDNEGTDTRAPNVTYTMMIQRDIDHERYSGLADNFLSYTTQVTNQPGPICRDPILQFPQQSNEKANRKSNLTEANAQKVIAEHKQALLGNGSSPSKTPRPSSTPKATQKPQNTSQEKMSISSREKEQQQMIERQNAAQILSICFRLDSFQTSHWIFMALADFFDVVIGKSTSTVPTRVAAHDILTNALVQRLRDGLPAPTYEEIKEQADILEVTMTPCYTPGDDTSSKNSKIKKPKSQITTEQQLARVAEMLETTLVEPPTPDEPKGRKDKKQK